MCASWVNRFNPDVVCDALDGIKKSDASTVTFEGTLHYEFVAVLPSMVQFERYIPDRIQQRIINQATFNVARTTSINSRSLIREISRLEKEYHGKQKQRYVLLTLVSIPSSVHMSSVRLAGGTITFSDCRPKGFRYSEQMKKRIDQLGIEEPQTGHSWVRVSVWARDEPEAGDKAFEALNFIRGIWNFSINRRTGMRFWSLRPIINQLILGPFMTLHFPNGMPANDQFWFEPEYGKPAQQGPLDWKRIKSDEAFIRKKLRSHGYADTMILAFNLYCRALDHGNLNIAFVRLFSVLELLSRKKNERSDDVINRLKSLFSDRDMAIEYLKHLYEFRNRAVHEAYHSDLAGPVLFQLKRIVETLMLHHLRAPAESQSLENTLKILEDRTYSG